MKIELRAWDKIDQKMYYNIGISPCGVQVYVDDGKFPEKCILHRGRACFEIMQYIGFNDKNGTKIYEGDIYKSWHALGEELVNGIFVPCAGEPMIRVVYDTRLTFVEFSDTMDMSRIEVIGNRFEHPELVAKKSFLHNRKD